jgi:hypothetical protein
LKGYKAFKKNMTCRGFQFEEGQTYETDKAVICETGFHFCENPLDTLNYYSLCESEFAEVEALGETQTHDSDSKVCTTKIKIGSKLGLSGFVKASVDFLLERCAQGAKSKKKDCSKLATSGDYSQLAALGDHSRLEITGSNSVGAAIGVNNIIKASLGCWITLAEYKWDGIYYIPICVKSAQVDGEIIKANVWYKLSNGEFIECNLDKEGER